MVTFDFDKSFDDNDVALVKAACRETHGSSVAVAPGWVSLGFIDLHSITPLASLLVAVISLCLTIRRDMQARSTQERWTADRVRSFVATELLSRGIVEFEIRSIENFSCLENGEGCPCGVTISSPTRSLNMTLCVFRNGETFSFSTR